MEIMIEIDDELYNEILSRKYSKTRIEKAVANGKPLSKTIDSLKELFKDHRHNFVGNSCEERAWRLGIEDSIDLILAESEG